MGSHRKIIVSPQFTQKEQIKNITGSITCTCGATIKANKAYKCFYCRIWLCRKCGADHFNTLKLKRAKFPKVPRHSRLERLILVVLHIAPTNTEKILKIAYKNRADWWVYRLRTKQDMTLKPTPTTIKNKVRRALTSLHRANKITSVFIYDPKKRRLVRTWAVAPKNKS